jgi:hypothetical protein
LDIQKLNQQISVKEDNAGRLSPIVARNPALIPTVLEGIKAPAPAIKYKCLKILNLISAQNPAVLYSYFEEFVKLLDSPKPIFKWNAIDIVANLSAADIDDKFGPLLDKFYGLMGEGSLITAAHVVESSAVIVKNRPDRESIVTSALLVVESIPLPTEECRNILRGKVITTFSQYFHLSVNKPALLEFAHQQISNSRPATHKKAAQFVLKHAAGNT